MLQSIIAIVLLGFASGNHAASFDCAKAATQVEKSICAESQISDLDNLLMLSYKKALANAADSKSLKPEQRAWLANVRNKCQDSSCLRNAYEERIKQLNTYTTQKNEPKDIVMGDCHMLSCWWRKIEKTELVQSESKGKLVKIYVRTTSIQFSDSEFEKNGGYPDFPPEKSQWENISEEFIFCSKRLPASIWCDKETKKCAGRVPFDESGSTMGATVSDGNLYSYICKSGAEPIRGLDVSPELAFSELTMEKPTDIFDYPIKW